MCEHWGRSGSPSLRQRSSHRQPSARIIVILHQSLSRSGLCQRFWTFVLVVRNNKLGIIQRLVAVSDSSATSAVHLPISPTVLFFLLLILKLHKLTHMQMLEHGHLLKSNMFMVLIIVIEAQAPCIIPHHRMRRDALYSAVTQ